MMTDNTQTENYPNDNYNIFEYFYDPLYVTKNLNSTLPVYINQTLWYNSLLDKFRVHDLWFKNNYSCKICLIKNLTFARQLKNNYKKYELVLADMVQRMIQKKNFILLVTGKMMSGKTYFGISLIFNLLLNLLLDKNLSIDQCKILYVSEEMVDTNYWKKMFEIVSNEYNKQTKLNVKINVNGMATILYGYPDKTLKLKKLISKYKIIMIDGISIEESLSDLANVLYKSSYLINTYPDAIEKNYYILQNGLIELRNKIPFIYK